MTGKTEGCRRRGRGFAEEGGGEGVKKEGGGRNGVRRERE